MFIIASDKLVVLIAKMSLQYHGDPSRDNHFWVYLRNQPLQNPRWDTHNAEQFCYNHKFIQSIDGQQGIAEYQCQGHNTLFHGDTLKQNYFIYVYPMEHETKKHLENNWETYDINDLCNNYQLVKDGVIKIYKCNGHRA
ncbi:unnamed protein product [Didymodactylos carnosus]|uniref:Uncharacterized protein n=1 Tax=Didymodactylos carnosus TaxID=1234261 RepID=A0A814DRZ7_9BILA|nr:unnamed protein product [Didymodactylos carnosus]CAF0958307.1 unnamed protein product [Didymodactylos carnosus]CAF3721861.1 unnamed protein product [Didymodactylos carnosus]CAF3733174.1 unnamed protein product [Didymodactylos carnosus]